jgi:hypothetical protein
MADDGAIPGSSKPKNRRWERKALTDDELLQILEDENDSDFDYFSGPDDDEFLYKILYKIPLHIILFKIKCVYDMVTNFT